MSYKNKVYVSMDADSDINYYWLMKAWKQNDNSDFNFYDAHDINNNYDKSEDSIKRALMERFRNTKVFVLLVGEHTRFLYRYVRWEIEQALKRELPIIVVNINGMRDLDGRLCPPILKDKLALHISYNQKIMQYALEHWPAFDAEKRAEGISTAFHYGDGVYSSLGL